MIVRARALMYVEMEDMLARKPGLLQSSEFCFISILVPDQKALFPPDSERWVTLSFHDVTRRIAASLKRHGSNKYQGMTEAQADVIVAHLRRWHEVPEAITLLVHCQAGVSRSAAVADFAREQFGLNSRMFAEDNPHILPNDLMLEMLQRRWVRNGNGG